MVCTAKYRQPVLTEQGLLGIEGVFKAVAKKMNFRVLEFNGEWDHIHALIEYLPKLSVSQIVHRLKGGV